jgi:hypothetical protein
LCRAGCGADHLRQQHTRRRAVLQMTRVTVAWYDEYIVGPKRGVWGGGAFDLRLKHTRSGAVSLVHHGLITPTQHINMIIIIMSSSNQPTNQSTVVHTPAAPLPVQHPPPCHCRLAAPTELLPATARRTWGCECGPALRGCKRLHDNSLNR